MAPFNTIYPLPLSPSSLLAAREEEKDTPAAPYLRFAVWGGAQTSDLFSLGTTNQTGGVSKNHVQTAATDEAHELQAKYL